MIQDIKVDIIYYMTATDFEFEFNLGGCCHMRLLNDKAKDKKSFVNALARAVSRSRIIISCGPLFGEDGLINTIATAIGHTLEEVNNKAYGISGEEKIEIISGSVPLVTPEGYFGGCIIESGPQSIIVLTENRTLRKSIMKTLIHPYISDISTMNSSDKISAVETEDKIVEPQTETQPAEDETVYIKSEETEPIVKTETDETDGQEETEKTEPYGEENYNLEFDYSFGEDKSTLKQENNESGPDNLKVYDNDMFVQGDSKKKKKKKRKKSGKGLNISIIIVSVFLVLAILALCWFLVVSPIRSGVSIYEYFEGIFKATSSTVSV